NQYFRNLCKRYYRQFGEIPFHNRLLQHQQAVKCNGGAGFRDSSFWFLQVRIDGWVYLQARSIPGFAQVELSLQYLLIKPICLMEENIQWYDRPDVSVQSKNALTINYLL